MYSNSFFQSDEQYIKIEEGVNQGSPLSPGFFDVYFADFIEQWKIKIGDHNIWNRGYADDLVFIQTQK